MPTESRNASAWRRRNARPDLRRQMNALLCALSTQDVLNRFVAALGGTLKLIADFGDEQLKIA